MGISTEDFQEELTVILGRAAPNLSSRARPKPAPPDHTASPKSLV